MNERIRVARIETFRLRAEVPDLPQSTLGAKVACNGLHLTVYEGRVEVPTGDGMCRTWKRSGAFN